MLSQLHILLTYTCNKTCDHCFVYSSPESLGTFTINQLKYVISEAKKIGSIEWIYFEGGEPFLFFPLLIKGLKLAKREEFKLGVVTNGFWATSEENAKFYLKSLAKIGIDDLSVSDDCFHMFNDDDHPSILISDVGKEMGIPVNTLTVLKPDEIPVLDVDPKKIGEPITGGNIRITGRAAEKLSKILPIQPALNLISCEHEDLLDPMRVHLDSFGNVHICQGISLGNMWEQPLTKIILNYDPYKHPIVNFLLKGGPLELAQHYGIQFDETFTDTCHMCFEIRKTLRGYHPEYLQPSQIYGQ